MKKNKLPDFNIKPCDITEAVNAGYKKVALTGSQKSELSFLISELPMLAASKTLSNAYICEFPKDVTGHLMRYKNGNFGSPIIGESGVVAHASFQQLSEVAAMTQMMSLLSLASGQYFLSQINSEMKIINQKIDNIINFLYGDKKAELMAEISFIKYAHENFSFIMLHEAQRIATLSSLQSAKRTAMKNIEFYVDDITSKSVEKSKNYSEFSSQAIQVLNFKGSLDLAVQLYITSSVMEIYYSQNTDPDYIRFVKNDITNYVEKCDKRILASFNVLQGRNIEFTSPLKRKPDIASLDDKLTKAIGGLNNGKANVVDLLDHLLKPIVSTNSYCITRDGELYIMAS